MVLLPIERKAKAHRMRRVLPTHRIGRIEQRGVGRDRCGELLSGHVAVKWEVASSWTKVVPSNSWIADVCLACVVGEGGAVVEHAAAELIDQSRRDRPVKAECRCIVLIFVARDF